MLLAKKRRPHLVGLLELLGRGIVSSADADSFVQLLRGTLGVHGIMILQNARHDAWNATSGIPASWLAKHQELQAEDPSKEILASRPPGTFYFVERDLPPEDRTSPLRRAFMSCGLRDAAVTKLHSPFFEDLFLAVYRHDGESAFTEDDRLLLALLHPHLAGALATRRSLGALQSSGAPADRGPVVAYARLSWPLRRVDWSEQGRREWTLRLGPQSASGWKRIERAIWSAASHFQSAQTGGRSQVILPDLRVEFAYVPPERGETRAMLAMFHANVDEARTTRPAPVEELLSPRELAIARGVAAGAPLADVAKGLGITRETARTHLRAVYTRLRVSGRIALAKALEAR